MATIKASEILTGVSRALQDQTFVRWPKAELLDWLNVGQRSVVQIRPAAYMRNVVHGLIAGSLQTVPADCIRLLDVPRNIADDGVTVLEAITPVKREIMDRQNPAWHTDVNAKVTHWMYDPAVPNLYWIWPGQPPATARKVTLIYGAVPPALTADTQVISLGDQYASALGYYILYRALSKDTDYADESAAKHYEAMFMADLKADALGQQGANAEVADRMYPNSRAP